MNEERFRELVGRAYDRNFHPPGVARQLHAINCSGNRTRRLRTLDLPALVIHGTADPLVRPVGGRETARAIPGARLRMIEGMGHDLPPAASRADRRRDRRERPARKWLPSSRAGRRARHSRAR